MTLTVFFQLLLGDLGTRSLCSIRHVESQDCLVNSITNYFELRSHLKLDQQIALSHRSDKAVLLKGEIR
jgi:hypothetical protein